MKWVEISIRTTHEATEAVANIFHEVGASGVVIEDPDLVNAYRAAGRWDYCDIPESTEEGVVVKAYLPADAALTDKVAIITRRVNDLHLYDLDKGAGSISLQEVHEADWASAWKDYYHPVRVGERLVIKPTWESCPTALNDLVIELDPGMAFGTGTHATTVLCLACLENYLKPGMTVLDVGTGSGILAIAAAKLGAAKVTAVDIDSVAVRVARENVAINKVEHLVAVREGNLLDGIDGDFDVITANIVADVIMALAPAVPAALKPGGIFIASGIIDARLADVTAAVTAAGLVVNEVRDDGGWSVIVARRE